MNKIVLHFMLFTFLVRQILAYMPNILNHRFSIKKQHRLKAATNTLDADINSKYSEEVPSETLNLLERIGRAGKFYSKAVPVFVSYKLLAMKLSSYPLEKKAEDDEWDKLHEWGSDVISKAIT